MILKSVFLFVAVATIVHQTECVRSARANDLFHDSNGVFSIYLYSNLSNTEEGNILISPVSLNYALTAASLGTAENSLTQMRTVLNQADDLNSIISSYRQFSENSNKDQTLTLVTQMYVDKQFNVKNKFKDDLTNGFDAGIESLDFANEPEVSRKTINSYVDKKTNHLIPQLFQKGSVNEKMSSIIVSAVYFKSKWESPFAESDTKKKVFYGENKQYQVDMMFKAGKSYRYVDNKEINAQVIEIPYKGDYSLVVILPKDKKGISNVESLIKSKVKSTTSSPFIDILEGASWEQVDVFLPKFELQQDFKLKGTLQTMGIKDIFTGKANFDNLSDSKVHMSDVVQNTYFSIDETGTFAGSAPGPETGGHVLSATVTFNVDHPFLYVIKLGSSNTPLFVGKCMNP